MYSTYTTKISLNYVIGAPPRPPLKFTMLKVSGKLSHKCYINAENHEIKGIYSRLPNKRPGTAIHFEKIFHPRSPYLAFKMGNFDAFLQ